MSHLGSSECRRGSAQTQTPSRAVYMGGEGVEKLSTDPIQGHQCLP